MRVTQPNSELLQNNNNVRICYVIGNGLSRKDLNLHKHVKKYQHSNSFTIGCNYIYKDYVPNIIVAQDTKVLIDLAKSDIDTLIYVPHRRLEWLRNTGHLKENDNRFHKIIWHTYAQNRWKTGEQAIWLAVCFGYFDIRLIAFDGGEDSLYRERDGVSQIDKSKMSQRIEYCKTVMCDDRINIREDNLQKPSL